MYKDGTQERIIKELARKYKLDPRLVRNVSYYPIKFAKSKMEDPTNNRGIRIRYFGLFTQRHIVNKDFLFRLRTDALLDHIDEVAIMMGAVLGFQIPTAESAKKIITDALESKDYEKLEMIWEEWSYYSNKRS